MMYASILKNIILPLGDFAFSSTYTNHLRRYRKLLQDKQIDFADVQQDRLTQTLKLATENSAYYKPFKEIFDPTSPIESLKKFPILTKDIIRTKTAEILTLSTEKMIKNSTSGSTGEQTHIFITKDELSQIRAIQTIWWEWAGFEPGYPMLQTGLATQRTLEKRLKDLMFRTQYVFAFGLTLEQLAPLLPWIKRNKPFLGGYASSLYVLSQLLENENVTFKSAVSWGDKLFDHYKKNIEKVFGCSVFETYGTGEGLMIAAQKDLEYMYLMSPIHYMEIVDDDGNEVDDGQLGNVLITSFIHKGMPLIRYKPGDLAIKLPLDKYPAHRSLALPLLQKVIGRETDIVQTPSGKKLIVHSFTGIFEYFPEIKQFCVIQNTPEKINIEYIKGEGFQETVLQTVEAQLMNHINEPFKIQFREVQMIPPTKSGKPQIIISHLKE